MPAPLLAVEDVSVRFAGLAALDNVSMSVTEREVVSLIGPNGAGKTTLFNVICGFVRPVSGRVTIGGRTPRRTTDLARLRVARTLQGVSLWKGVSVLENVMSGGHVTQRGGFVSSFLGAGTGPRHERELRDRAWSVLERLGASHAANALPGELPYGVQKRVAIARALMADPALLLLDEPASGLAPAEMDELAALLAECRTTMAVLLVEHHMDFVMAISDRIVVLNFGRVIAAGTPDEVQTDPEVTDAYLGEQVDEPGSAHASDPPARSAHAPEPPAQAP